ncbi:MAG TPA: protein-L-isoaspartate O-methyltransferase [Thermoplasmatales archaeon]|nr:protein-L-isoaspartate O-methyltransferase [Thermoplasmatales archaeon]
MEERQRKLLIDRLVEHGYIKSEKVKKALLSVPRELFVSDDLKDYAYADTPLEIGNGQTISAPHMVAIMCETLDLKEGQKVLEIGSGSGYHAAVVAKIIGEKGHVYSIERITELAERARENLKRAGIDNVTVITGDGSLGLPEYAPYDRIYVTCAAPSIPEPLKEQLMEGGIIVIPVGRMFSTLTRGVKIKGKLKTEDLGGCAFVPLVGKYGY